MRGGLTPRSRVPPAPLGPRLNLGTIPPSVRLGLGWLREGRVGGGELRRTLPRDSKQPGDIGCTQGIHHERTVPNAGPLKRARRGTQPG